MLSSRSSTAQAGFTLIELMVVVAVIGLLTAIAVPQYQEYTARTQMARAVSELAAYKTSIEEHLGRGMTSPTAIDLGYVRSNLTGPISTDGLWTYAAATRTGYLKVNIGGNASAAIHGSAIQFDRSAEGMWRCTVTPPANRAAWRASYVPGDCIAKTP
ncbi:pilin [Cupriavidus plantarum]|uniref:Type IV pilus assembly protein PilA n=1 Tax=Cupriavidus plantarum TaxID=942865 RepID=A0A316FDF9_9BURK|nr:pilin [Cupriavidus plantarum]NYI00979.1 type IV pilus assembly protein PilA [Cupriavidus plantarum]PWK35390.1 type IV pilus assembly protein PilA [Cupriavidus plantarum]RLK39255.1 type IV pilus assembly protein PilA [Cupriavidus plantarum]CAG2134455.1 Fimbrial protein [Cupriavidus plantarum]SMR84414.1 type IV pilus assembly protein PilA [Cupriavidus plantarum]